MSKLPTFLPFLLFLICQTACYEPQEGCLDLRATNYAVDADDPCGDCCIFPILTVQMQHRVDFPDTSFSFRYKTLYPSPFNILDSFVVDRARFYISNLRLVREDGEEIGALDTLRLEAPMGTFVTVEDNFAKFDRDNFQSRKLGTFITEGVFTGVKLTLGLETFLQQTDPASVPTGHPLSTAADSLNYDAAVGYIPSLLIFRNDTTAVSDSLEIQIFEPETVFLPFEEPFLLEQGFDIDLTLKMDYLAWFNGIDLENEPLEVIRQKVAGNLRNAISVAQISR